MSPQSSIERLSWAFLGANAVVLAAALVAYYKWKPARTTLPAELQHLRSQREQLAGNTDTVRAGLEAQAKVVSGRIWTDIGLAQFEKSLERDWRWEWTSPREKERVRLHGRRGDLLLWPALLGTLRALAREPGVIVERIDAEAQGDARNRRFVRVSFEVRFVRPPAAPGDAERAAPSRGPLPVAAAIASAPPRKIGPVIPFLSIPARPSGSAGL